MDGGNPVAGFPPFPPRRDRADHVLERNPSPGSSTNASRPSPSTRTLYSLDIESRFARHVEKSRLLEGEERVVAACSGGGDSTALLLLLASLSKNPPPGLPFSFDLAACHVAHGIRGKAGEDDALFVAELSASLGIPFFLRQIDVPTRRRKGESLEAAARRLRYGALLGLAEELGAGTRVATGHTLDDQAETVLLNLHRHAGRTRGGIRERRTDGVVRPLLPFSRAELRAFLSSRGVPWREDETNADERLLRSRIRHRELPVLEAEWPGASARLARAAAAWSQRLEELDRAVDAALAASASPLGGPWPRALLSALGPEAAARLLVRAAGARGGVPGRTQLAHVVGRLLGTEARVGESLAGLRLTADERAVRLAGRPPRP
jgi:tRNA(Ile)-lysidine synthase